VKPNNSEDTSGTPGYMSPEVICKMNHSYPVDYFALGVIAYELMMGKVSIKLLRDPTWVLIEKKLERR
jgi:serine/threonine protein kinase